MTNVTAAAGEGDESHILSLLLLRRQDSEDIERQIFSKVKRNGGFV